MVGFSNNSLGRQGEDDQDQVPSFDELYDMAESLFPGKMKCLHDEFLELLGNAYERRSILKEVLTSGDMDLEQISDQLTNETLDHYSPKFNSMFLLHFDKSNRLTDEYDDHDDHDDHFESSDHKYVRLGTTHDERMEEGYDAKVHDVKHSFTSDKPLQLVLLFNDLFDRPVRCGSARDFYFDDADRDRAYVRYLFRPAASIVNNLFSFTQSFRLGLRVNAGFEVTLPNGTRRADFAVTVDTVNEDTKAITSTECVSVVEFERPNAGFWIAWGPLTGQGWTGAERNAFFKLKKLRIESFGWFDDEELKSWQNNPLWKSVEDALERIGSNRVQVKYDKTETNSDKTEDGRTGPGSAQSSQTVESGELARSYYIEAANGDPEDITALLESAKFKRSFDLCHDALARVAPCAVLNKCSRVAIADGLTFIAGSLNKLEKTEGSNPTDSDDVLDAHFYNTHMIQKHDQDSLVHIVNYFTEGAMSCSSIRSAMRQLLVHAKPGQDAKGPTTPANKLERMVRGCNLNSRSANPGVKFPALEKSRQLLTKKARGSLVEALADICKRFPELNTKLDHIASDSFAIVKWYRRDIHEFYHSDESPFPGRSKSVARVQRHGDTPGAHLVLKEYYSDEDSVAGMKRELEAYYRVSRLPNDQTTKHVANLVSFGSLDLNDGTPRLFLMLECVEGPDTLYLSLDKSVISAEVDKVDSLLESVGVDHNDLEDRNYKLQLDSDGNWYIKVFDFDKATFKVAVEYPGRPS